MTKTIIEEEWTWVNKDVTKVCIGKIEELPEQLGKNSVY
ncbi:assimilatory nitrite reductase subunit [Bacillus subtilis]|nr:assimilatory nitrite reductase subunit [Bacillus subtilis]